MIEKIRNNAKYIFFFCFFFFSLVFFYNLIRGDSYVNYGFSYAISRGEIPYVDFNLVILPFAPFLYSIFLYIEPSILTFYLEQALLLTIFFFFLFKVIKNNTWLYFIILCIPYPVAMVSIIFPGYNFLLLFFFLLLIYCEVNKKSDYLIGILLGLAFLTKQTVGGLLFLVSFVYLFKNYRKFFKRIVAFLIPVLVIFLMLIVNGSFFKFFDLCFLGLFDFGKDNLSIDWFYFVVFIICFILLIIRITKKPKDISNYYLLLFSSCCYPIFDYYHVSLFLGAFFIIFLQDFTIKRKISYHAIFFVLALSIIWFIIQNIYFSSLKVVNYTNFPCSLVSEKYYNSVRKLGSYTEKLDKDIIYLLKCSENYFYKIKNNLDITYFDLPNYGNYGYDGVSKLLNRLKKVKNSYFILDKSAYLSKDSSQQYIKEVYQYIVDEGVKVKEIGYYQIYYIE